MLVVTRRNQEKIVFPDIGLKIQVLRILGGNVRLGVEAPKEISILRDELTKGEGPNGTYSELASKLRHQLRNDLQQISVAMHLFKELREANRDQEAEETFLMISDTLKKIDGNPLLSRFVPPKDQLPPEPQSVQLVLAEDDFEQRTILARLLRLRGMEVIELSNGSEVVSYFDNNSPPRFLLIDMNMPTCDGATAVQKLRNKGQLDKTLVFAVSGRTPEDYGLKIGAGSAGVDSWFPKPIDPEALMGSLQANLEVA